jgi:hypothetical protein
VVSAKLQSNLARAGPKQAPPQTKLNIDPHEHPALDEPGQHYEYKATDTALPARLAKYGRHQDDHRAVLRKPSRRIAT